MLKYSVFIGLFFVFSLQKMQASNTTPTPNPVLRLASNRVLDWPTLLTSIALLQNPQTPSLPILLTRIRWLENTNTMERLSGTSLKAFWCFQE